MSNNPQDETFWQFFCREPLLVIWTVLTSGFLIFLVVALLLSALGTFLQPTGLP